PVPTRRYRQQRKVSEARAPPAPATPGRGRRDRPERRATGRAAKPPRRLPTVPSPRKAVLPPPEVRLRLSRDLTRDDPGPVEDPDATSLPVRRRSSRWSPYGLRRRDA